MEIGVLPTYNAKLNSLTCLSRLHRAGLPVHNRSVLKLVFKVEFPPDILECFFLFVVCSFIHSFPPSPPLPPSPFLPC